jgi:Rod binding domain-containing protein
MQIDAGLVQYRNQPLKIPGGASAVQGLGARVLSNQPIDTKSPLFAQCKDFESIFTKMMLKEMRKTVDKTDAIISGGFAEDIYQDMLDDQYSKTMSNAGNFGLAEMLYKQLA